MKKYLIACGIFYLSISTVFSQNIIEVKPPDISRAYFETMEKAEEIRLENPDEAIRYLNDLLPQIQHPYERYNIIFWGLVFPLAGLERYQECFDILKNGQQEEFYFPFRTGERRWPAFLDQLDALDGFAQFMEQNDALRNEEIQTAKAEYFVQVPEGYTERKAYPLLMVLHGGSGSHIQSWENWQSSKLKTEYIVAYLQGSECRGSYLRSFQRDNFDNIRSIYEQIIERYSVDRKKVILGGPSAGGRRSLSLALDEIIPAAGLLLGFPVIPLEMEESKIQAMKDRGMRIVMITGEYDRRVKRQKELAVILDKHELPNRFLIFSGKGHEYPDDFSKEIDLSLNFIFPEEE